MTGKADRPVRFSRRLARLAPAACVLLLVAGAAPASAESPGDHGDHRHPTVRGAVAPPRGHAGQAAAQGEGRGDRPAWPDAAAPRRRRAGNEDQDAANVAPSDNAAAAALAVTPPKVAAARAGRGRRRRRLRASPTWKADRWTGSAPPTTSSTPRTTPLTAADARAPGRRRHATTRSCSPAACCSTTPAAAASSAASTAPSGTLLWAYERDYARPPGGALHAATAPGPRTTASTRRARARSATPRCTAALTAAGAGVFDYLKTNAPIPIVAVLRVPDHDRRRLRRRRRSCRTATTCSACRPPRPTAASGPR